MTIAPMKVGGEDIFLFPKFGEAKVVVSDLENKESKLENLRPNGLPLALFSDPGGVQIELVGEQTQ